MAEHFLKTAETQVESAGGCLKTVVGSCVALCLWDPAVRVGGMVHVMMPVRNGDASAPPGKYADTGVPALVEAMTARGARVERMTAVYAGGASMFRAAKAAAFAVGERNADAVRDQLRRFKIPVRHDDAGGTAGRRVVFDCAAGTVRIIRLGDPEPVIALN